MADATRACDVAQPLESNDPRWQNFADARGDDAVAVLRRTFRRKASGTSQHVLFVSHRGAGKSTELKRFCGDLDQQYQALYLEANMELDPFTIEGEDLLLMLAQAVEEKMRQIGLPLPIELCDRTLRDRLIAASGGSIRELLEFVRAATLLTDDPPLTAKNIEDALSGFRQRMRDLANNEQLWPALVHIAREKQLPPGGQGLRLLFHRLVLKYNGEGWYDVHPLVSEIPEFKREFERAAQPPT